MNSKTQEAKNWREAIKEFDKAEHAQRERDRSNGLVYSLDDEEIRDYLEHQCAECHLNPHRVLVRKEAVRTLYHLMNELSPAQKGRIQLHFWEQKSYSEIARLEGVDESAVRHSIQRGLKQLKKGLIGTGVSENDFAEHLPTRYVKHFHSKKEGPDRQSNPLSLITIRERGATNGE